MLRDLTYSVRRLYKAPGFTLIAALTLALGIGASTTIFSIVNAVLLRQLPYAEPDRLVMIWETSPEGDDTNVVSPANYVDWKDGSDAFAEMSLLNRQGLNLTGAGEPEELAGVRVGANYFRLLGGEAGIGRTFADNEGTPGADTVVVLAHRLWQRRFGADPSILGQSITLDGAPATVIGVMPASFRPLDDDTELWIAWSLDAGVDYRVKAGRYLLAIGRLRDGVSIEQASTQLSTVARRLETEHPEFNKGWGVNLVPLKEQLTGEVRPALLVLFGAVCFLVLIACANVANLLLARAGAREKELAVRASMGAERGGLIRHLLLESLLLAFLGGAGGVALAVWSLDAVLAFGQEYLPAVGAVTLDPRVLAFTFGLSLLTGLIAGLAPALTGSRVSLSETLKEGGRSSSGGLRSARLRSVLVVTEVALAVILLVGCGLMISTFLRLQSVDPGFQPDNLLTIQIGLPDAKYTEPLQRFSFFDRAVEELSALPGIESATGTVFLPFSGMRSATDFTIVGRPKPPPGEQLMADVRIVKDGYFSTLGIPILRGRGFEVRDTGDAPRTFVINEALAKEHWPDENPIGHQLVVEMGNDIPGTIIGVVANVRHTGFDGSPLPTVYYHHPHLAAGFMTLVARTDGPPESRARMAVEAIRRLDPELPVTRVRPMTEWLERSVAPERFRMLLLSLFSGSALLLASLGIYGVIAFSVHQRRHEVGIRMALGAQSGAVAKMVLWQALRLTLIGGVIGAASAAMLARPVESLLFNVSPIDPGVYAAVILLLTGVASAASALPAWRAARVDPLRVLRYE